VGHPVSKTSSETTHVLRRGIVRVRLQLLNLANVAFIVSGGSEGPLISVGEAVGASSEHVQRRRLQNVFAKVRGGFHILGEALVTSRDPIERL